MTRRRAWFVSLAVIAGAVVVAFLWLRHSADAHDPRADVIRHYLAAQYSQQAWYAHVKGVSVHSGAVYVSTDLPPWIDKTHPLDPAIRQVSRAIYNPLWHYIQYDQRVWHLGWVYILDRNGNYLDGGAG